MSNTRPPSLSDYQPSLEHGAPAGERPPALRPMRGPAGGRRRRSRSRRLLSALGYLGLAVACLMLAAGTFLMIAAPTDIVRDQIVAQVKARTGRDLVLAGPASVTVFPSLGIRLSDVTLSAHPSMGGAATATMASLDVNVKVMPLLRREVVVERLVMHKPVFDLRIDADGRRSWDFAAAPAPAAWPHDRYAQAGGAPGGRTMPPDLKDFVRNASDPVKAQHGAARASLEGLELGDVRIEDGTINYSDAASGVRHLVKSIHVRLALKTIAHPLDAKGSLVWRGERIDFDGKLTSVQVLLDDKPARLTARIAGAPLQATYEGSLALRDGLAASGVVDMKTASVRSLARWAGNDLPAVPGFGPASITGSLKASSLAIALETARITLDGATAEGTLGAELAGSRPLLRANLKLSELDLNKYMSQAGRAPARQQSRAGTGAAPGAQTGGAATIEELLRRGDVAPPASPAGPQVKGFEQRASGWSDEPIDLAPLRLVDADLRLSCARLLYQDIKVGQSLVTVSLKGAVARVSLDDVQLYEGRGRGFLTLDATAQSPNVGINLQLEGISALPLLEDAAGFDTLAGRGKLALALAGSGRSQRQIVETLNGKADFTFVDGAVVGWNIPQIMRGLQQGRFSGFSKAATERTDFSELAATFTVANGIASNKDLRMLSPLLRVTGSGTVMLPPRQVDYVMRPKLVASLAGQTGQQDASGLEVPVKVQGSWDRPSIAPDVGAILKDPNQAAATAEKIGEQLGIKGAGNAVRNFLGGGQGQQQGASQPKARQLLDQLLKR